MNHNQFEHLKYIDEGLYATPTTELPFDSRFEFKSLVLQRDSENVIIYHSSHLKESEKDINALGGADKLLMNHDHESLGGSKSIDVSYFINENDASALKPSIPVEGYLNQHEMLYDDLEVIPAPGHTTELEQHYIYGIMVNIAIYSLVISYALKVINGVQLF